MKLETLRSASLRSLSLCCLFRLSLQSLALEFAEEVKFFETHQILAAKMALQTSFRRSPKYNSRNDVLGNAIEELFPQQFSPNDVAFVRR